MLRRNVEPTFTLWDNPNGRTRFSCRRLTAHRHILMVHQLNWKSQASVGIHTHTLLCTLFLSSHRRFTLLQGGLSHSSGRDVYRRGSHRPSPSSPSPAPPSNLTPVRQIRRGSFFFLLILFPWPFGDVYPSPPRPSPPAPPPPRLSPTAPRPVGSPSPPLPRRPLDGVPPSSARREKADRGGNV